jgi:D-xylulose reductase
MKALVLQKKGEISLQDLDIQEELGPRDVRIAVGAVGICGSDIHYYRHGKIGPFVVREPMILGHEAAGTVLETGADVTHLKPGDRVAMEPGIPDPFSRESRAGMYNLDPAVRFWATPPVHGVLRPEVVHPADFSFRLPDSVSLQEGALVEPLAIGMHAAGKAEIQPGDTAVVIGAGTIGIVTALAALAGGCSRVIMTDLLQPKLDLASKLGPISPVNIKDQNPLEAVRELTGGWGADIVFEASGSRKAMEGIFDFLRPGGRIVFIGMPTEAAALDIVAAQAKEISMKAIFRYAHVYPRAIALMGSGRLDVKPLISRVFPFEKSVEAFEYAADPDPDTVKVQIVMG